MPDSRPDRAAQIWLDADHRRKADEIAARLVLRGHLGSRVTRVQAVQVAIDELYDHLEDQASQPLPAG